MYREFSGREIQADANHYRVKRLRDGSVDCPGIVKHIYYSSEFQEKSKTLTAYEYIMRLYNTFAVGHISSLYLGNLHTQWGWNLRSGQARDKPKATGDINRDGLDDIIIINDNGTMNAIFTPASGRYGNKSKYRLILGDATEWGIESVLEDRKALNFFDWWWK